MQKKKTYLKKTSNTKKITTKKKGFTLIELLAVIIILGILMIIAIPSVTSYISDSRKSTYVDTAKEIMIGTRNVVNDGNLGMFDTNTTYYITASYIKTENASKSPYGEFEEAYVAVIYDGKGYKYYWISVDETGQGVRNIVKSDLLTEDDIESIKIPENEFTHEMNLEKGDNSAVVKVRNFKIKDVVMISNYSSSLFGWLYRTSGYGNNRYH